MAFQDELKLQMIEKEMMVSNLKKNIFKTSNVTCLVKVSLIFEHSPKYNQYSVEADDGTGRDWTHDL